MKAKTGNAYQVTGDLTFHGVTKPVTVQLTPVGSRQGHEGGRRSPGSKQVF